MSYVSKSYKRPFKFNKVAFDKSQNQHLVLAMRHGKSSLNEYHMAVYQKQEKQKRIITKKERSKMFSDICKDL